VCHLPLCVEPELGPLASGDSHCDTAGELYLSAVAVCVCVCVWAGGGGKAMRGVVQG
jgi:hypothetical protein